MARRRDRQLGVLGCRSVFQRQSGSQTLAREKALWMFERQMRRTRRALQRSTFPAGGRPIVAWSRIHIFKASRWTSGGFTGLRASPAAKHTLQWTKHAMDHTVA